jgi:surface protein
LLLFFDSLYIWIHPTPAPTKLLSPAPAGLPIEVSIRTSCQLQCQNITGDPVPNAHGFRNAIKEYLENPTTSPYGSIMNCWNVANITDMSHAFFLLADFNETLKCWNVSNVNDMNFMFFAAISFDQDIGSWDVSNVRRMDYMFSGASSFNQDIGSWNVSKIGP